MTHKLPPEDLHLWKTNTRDVKPLPKNVKRVESPTRKTAIPRTAKSVIPLQKRTQTSELRPPPPSMTRRDVRRIKIDARFDMHGFSLEKGFEALARFLHRAQEKRFKTVLVVTGKGSLSAENTLRRNLPKWAEESPLRDLISALHHPAKIQDGGNGAFYIDVRSRNKTRVKK